ncbi:hypothetical protein [Streptomyces sp. WMMB 322]|uniref:hypothetical protein n=1 Tax=Streptomyces sp. WMMB 322 TaxID=1286821 RepID=UPI0008239760|nr:hypothetical protein [Streptomyces sp. WMMB 322]SCK54498.1 hypothetical protein H180DRAFT_05003 [Streptomyces sp. WMMB 322]
MLSVPVVPLVSVPIVAGLLLLLIPTRTPATDPAGPTPPQPRRIAHWRRGSLAAGIVAAAALAGLSAGGNDVAAFLAGPALGVCVLAGCLAGELGVAEPKAQVRTAALRQRRVRDYFPRRLAIRLAALTVLLAGMLVFTHLSWKGISGANWVCGSSRIMVLYFSDRLGFSYAIPVLAALAAGAALSFVALRRIAHRPPLDAGPEALEADERQRHTSARAVISAWGAAVSAALAAGALAPGGVLNGFCPRSPADLPSILATLAGAAGIACLVHFLVQLVRVPAGPKDAA